MKLQTITVKAILCLGTDMFISRFSLRQRRFSCIYNTFLKEITFQYMPLWGAICIRCVAASHGHTLKVFPPQRHKQFCLKGYYLQCSSVRAIS